MQTLKRTLSLLLCCVLLAAFAPMVCAEEKILIEKAYATYTVPAAGEPFYFNAISVPDDANYTAVIRQVAHYKDGGYKYLADGDIVEAGVIYYVRILFSAKSGYRLEQWKTEYIINGAVANTFAGTDMPKVTFIPTDMRYARLDVPEDAAVGYKSTVTVTAATTGVPTGFYVALYDDAEMLAKGDNTIVRYKMDKMTESKTLTAKVIDLNGNVQSNADGKLEKEIKITVKTGFFDKVKAFFLGLFGLLPKVELKP